MRQQTADESICISGFSRRRRRWCLLDISIVFADVFHRSYKRSAEGGEEEEKHELYLENFDRKDVAPLERQRR